jgi:hypothetical protein
MIAELRCPEGRASYKKSRENMFKLDMVRRGEDGIDKSHIHPVVSLTNSSGESASLSETTSRNK